jgi:glycosyltransferase involved in cell wall biosynthesis
MSKWTIIMPCFNVAAFVRPLIEEACRLPADVIAIDDGSLDQTGCILKDLAIAHPNLHIISFKKNKGKGHALKEGFEYAQSHLKYQALIAMDSDGQHLVSEVEALAKPILEGFDVVIGARDFSTMPFRSRLGNEIVSFLLARLYHYPPIDSQTGMRAFSPRFIADLLPEIQGGQYEMELYCLLLALERGYKMTHITIPTIYINKNRSSHFSTLKDTFKILFVLLAHTWRQK